MNRRGSITASLVTIVFWVLLDADGSLANTDHVFAPDGSDFNVTFPSTPEIETVHVSGGKLVRASLLLPDTDGFMRAELFLYEHDAAQGITDQFIVSQLHAYADDHGLVNPEVRMIFRTGSRCGHLKAVKRLQQITAMYENMTCYGPKSMMTLYIGARADMFPPPGANKFISSLQRATR